MKKKRFPHNFFDSPDHPAFLIVNGILAFTILASITAAVLETVDSLAAYHLLFSLIEYGAVAVFTLEYIARLRLAKKPLRYIFSFFGCIDFLAIIPTLIGLADFTVLKIVRIIRMLRLLRMTHVATLADNTHKRTRAGLLYLFQLELFLITCLGALLILGTLLYIFENTLAPSIPAGMVWVIQIMAGINHVVPETVGGTYTFFATKIIGVSLFLVLFFLTGTAAWKRTHETR